MDILIKTVIVAGMAVFELWAAIPAGFVFGLPPFLIGIASIIGGIATVIIVTTIGGKIRRRILSKREKKDKQHGTLYEIWNKYGIIGLGLLAPLLTGVLIGSTIAVSLDAPKKSTLTWLSLGVIGWTILLVTLAALGIDFIFR